MKIFWPELRACINEDKEEEAPAMKTEGDNQEQYEHILAQATLTGIFHVWKIYGASNGSTRFVRRYLVGRFIKLVQHFNKLVEQSFRVNGDGTTGTRDMTAPRVQSEYDLVAAIGALAFKLLRHESPLNRYLYILLYPK